jgi:hypothetical protein
MSGPTVTVAAFETKTGVSVNRTDVSSDPNNCGACGHSCGPGGSCAAGQCSSCTDMIKDGQETDTDCGGPVCPRCPAGDSCLVNLDCQSGVCANSRCAVPTCTDHVQNGLETDVDCGGPSCVPCSTNQRCLTNTDCISGICTNNICG